MPKSSFLVVCIVFVQCFLLQPVVAQKLYPMGHTVEVEIYMQQYFITEKVVLKNKEQLHVNDEITEVNGQPIVEQLNNDLAETIKLTVKHGENTRVVQCSRLEWQLIQQKLSNVTDGIGTLTYVTEDLQHFGALGHQIQLRNYGQFENGYIHLATIQSVVKSEKNTPGYKIIHPTLALRQIGQLEHNNSVGVFGRWKQQYQINSKPLPIGQHDQIDIGEATILTQIKGNTVQSFTVNITKVEEQQFHFTVVDKALLQHTGGVIQGMSGSPVIQNDVVIGAITHMFVENPKKGVAIMINQMLEKSAS